MILLDRAISYAEDVVNGLEETTWEVKVQCKWFLNDYHNRQYIDDFRFYFDEDKLIIINNLLKLMNFATGFVAGKQVLEYLAPFQCFFIANVFGWRFKNNVDKFRYSHNILFIARKNAKTATIALVFILLMLTEQEYSEFYSICLTKELAAEIKKIMTQIINASPIVQYRFIVSTTKTGRITCKITNSFFEPRTAEAGKNNSVRPSGIVNDEAGNFTENSNFAAMASGMKNVINPIIFQTTTAYAINNSSFQEDLDYVRKVYEGVVEDERMFALLYYSDKENIWIDKGLYQANPLRLEENYETMREDRAKALIQTNLQEEFITKTMNVFVQENAEEKYLDIDAWKKGSVDKVDFEGKEVVVGVDLSISTDLTAVSIMYKEGDKYYLHSKGFLPSVGLESRREKIDYRQYERLGYCDIHDSPIVLYPKIQEYIRGIEDRYNCKIKCIVSDPYNALETMQNLAEDYEVIILKQTYTQLTSPTKAFRDDVYTDNIIYQENKLLDWCVSCATLNKGKSEDVMLNKANKNKQRIDLLVASVFCYSQLYLENGGIDLNALITDEYLDSIGW